ncbi:OTU domain-containing protein [Durusdinium trenchii]|uniref:OTU domain-containing protein n=1 Tax=Durusdinium trenchii TaxID=1381693 RepID=A0ABP0IQE1_9DINO
MREQKTSGAFDLGGLDLLPLLRPAIEKLLRELLNEFLSGDGLARLLGLQAAAKGELHAPPVKEKKPRKRGKKAHAPSDAKSAKPSVAPVIAPAKPAIAKPPPLPHDADGEWIEVKKPVKQTPWALRAQDWDSPLCPLDEVCKKIGEQKDEFKAVILIPNGEQKIVVENMLAGGGFKYAVLLVVLSKTEGISTTRAMPNAVSVESRPSTVVLCKICKPFASSDEWKNAERRAQAALTLWARSHKCTILDTWRWQRDGRDSHCRYVGLARVPNNEVDLLLGASGSAGWFVDAFKTTACSPWQIEWQQREDGEDDVQYLHRLRRSHCNLGIAAGTRHLGLRHLRQADAEVTRTWVLEHVPAEWTSDDVVNLVKASFSNVYMLSRRRSGRKLCDFFFRASAKADLDLQPFVVQQEGGNVTYWAKHHISKPFVAKETKSLPANRSMDLRVKQGNCVVTKAVATSSGEGGESQQPSEREDKKDAKKQKDGACFYHSAAKGLALLDPPINKLPLELRAITVEHTQKYSKEYALDWDGFGPDGKTNWLTSMSGGAHDFDDAASFQTAHSAAADLGDDDLCIDDFVEDTTGRFAKLVTITTKMPTVGLGNRGAFPAPMVLLRKVLKDPFFGDVPLWPEIMFAKLRWVAVMYLALFGVWTATWSRASSFSMALDSGLFRVAIISRCPIRQVFLSNISSKDRYCAGVIEVARSGGIEKIVICTIYAPVGNDSLAGSLTSEVVAALAVLTDQWLLLGGFNTTQDSPGVGKLLSTGAAFALDEAFEGQGELPGTFSENRRIDFGLSSHRLHAIEIDHAPGVGDHLAVRYQFNFLLDFESCRQPRRSTSFASDKEVGERFRDCWSASSFEAALERDVDEAWQILSNCAEQSIFAGLCWRYAQISVLVS